MTEKIRGRDALLAAATFAVATMAQAQAPVRFIPIPASSAGGGGQAVAVQMSAEEVRDRAGSGATVLPYRLPAGTYRNSASYPLSLNVHVGNGFHGQVEINGVLVADSRVRDSGTWTNSTAIVPAGATFTLRWHPVTASVTALANNATWQQTGIVFLRPERTFHAAFQASPPDFRNVYYCRGAVSTGSNWEDVTTRTIFYAVDANLHNLDCGEGARAPGRNITVLGYRWDSMSSPFIFSHTTTTMRNLSRQTGVVALDVNQTRNRCLGTQEARNNLEQTSVTWSRLFDVETSSQCTVTAVQNVYNGCPPSGCAVADPGMP